MAIQRNYKGNMKEVREECEGITKETYQNYGRNTKEI